MSPDWSATPQAVPFADFGDPQSLNLYGYVRNNPLGHADADGHCCSWSVSSATDWLNRTVNSAITSVQRAAANTGSQTLAVAATLAVGAPGEAVKILASPLSAGQATGTCMG